MKLLTFNANLNLTTIPNKLVINGSVITDFVDDKILIEVVKPQSIVETVLWLKLSVVKGKALMKGIVKPFVFNLNDYEAHHVTNVTIFYGKEESKTQFVKIAGL